MAKDESLDSVQLTAAQEKFLILECGDDDRAEKAREFRLENRRAEIVRNLATYVRRVSECD
jgi:hypothetical protein